jgi:P27 family predicted phage terminase small subunit
MAGNKSSGRRPKPTALHVLRGNPSKKPLNLAEPQPPADPVVVPDGLTPGARIVWGRMAPICVAMGTLSVGDVPAFVSFCELQASFDLLMVTKAAPGFALLRWTEDATGDRILVVHPVLRLERETAAALRPYYEHFGLTPAARSRIMVRPAAAPAVSKWA